MNTPEYAPPEVLNTEKSDVPLNSFSHPWSYDIWSLGMIFLELCAGFPIWLSLKSRINGRGRFMTGLMAVPGREKEKLLKQQETI
jgi:serine/threonine protein kinase